MISLSHEITKRGQIIHTIIFKELKKIYIIRK